MTQGHTVHDTMLSASVLGATLRSAFVACTAPRERISGTWNTKTEFRTELVLAIVVMIWKRCIHKVLLSALVIRGITYVFRQFETSPV